MPLNKYYIWSTFLLPKIIKLKPMGRLYCLRGNHFLCRPVTGAAEIHSHVKGKMNGCRQPPLTCLALSAIMQIWRASRFSPFTPFITLLFYTVFWTLHIIWRRTVYSLPLYTALALPFTVIISYIYIQRLTPTFTCNFYAY